MPRLLKTLLATVVLVGLLGAPVRYLLPPDPAAQAPFVPVILVVAGVTSYVFVYREGVEERREVTGTGPENEP